VVFFRKTFPSPNNGCVRSRDNAREWFPGGGGNAADAISGEGLWPVRFMGDVLELGSWGERVAGRWLLGGEYGGGAGATHVRTHLSNREDLRKTDVPSTS
jgi:hypothetical protein